MSTIARSLINEAAQNLVKDPSLWQSLESRWSACDAGKVRALRVAIQDHKYDGAHIDHVGTALAWCLGFVTVDENG